MADATSTKSTTKVVNCTCKNDFQDKRYGKGKRVANYSRKHNIYKCTVCSTSHQ